VVQGSAYDVLAHTIVTMEERGLGDRLQLALHDELVVDTEVAAEVQQIMLTPPPFLIEWAQRTPVLRTDRADMEHHWAKV
jgi:DNA polymerase-1